MIIVDTREKKWDHIRSYFEKNGIEYEVRKLDTADYSNPDRPGILIDRKANLTEIVGNVSPNRDDRFRREVERAYRQKVRFIVLIEGTNCRTVHDVAEVKRINKFSKLTGAWLFMKMFNLTMAYSVEWMFCRKSETAGIIARLLDG